MATLTANSGNIDMTLDFSAYIPAGLLSGGVQLVSANVTTTGARILLSNNSQVAITSTTLELIDSPGPNGPVDLIITGNFAPIATPVRSALITAGAQVNGAGIGATAATNALLNAGNALGGLNPAVITISRVDASGPAGSYTLQISTDLLRVINALVPIVSNANTPADIIQPGLATIFAGPDRYVGGNGNDIFVAFGGNDTVEGGGGTDTLLVSGFSGQVTVGSGTVRLPDGSVITITGIETVQTADKAVTVPASGSGGGGGGGGAGTFSRDAAGNVIATPAGDLVTASTGFVGNGNDTVFGLAGDDTIFGGASGTGVFNSDWLIGDAGNDQLFGEGGDDVLFGRTGNDSLSGGDAVDLMFGEEGNDTLNGGRGQDALLGGPGADRFVLTRDPGNPNIEGIFDFNRLEGDRIQFNPAEFTLKTAAAAVAAQITIPGIVLVGSQQVQTLYTAINFGSASDPQFLLLGGNPLLVASDFILG